MLGKTKWQQQQQRPYVTVSAGQHRMNESKENQKSIV